MSKNCDVIIMFSLIVTFYLTKTENRTKNLKRSSHTLALSEDTISAKNTDFSRKNGDISKIKRSLVLKGTLSENTCVCVLTCHI